MSTQPLEPGGYIQAHCTRCKEVLRHTIVALVQGRPVRVKCNTCGGEHAFREHAPPEPGAEPKKKERTPKQETMEAAWKEQLAIAAAKGKKGKTYATTESFRSGDVLDHASFGVGVIQRLMGPGKILVLFRDGARTLLCRSPS